MLISYSEFDPKFVPKMNITLVFGASANSGTMNSKVMFTFAVLHCEQIYLNV